MIDSILPEKFTNVPQLLTSLKTEPESEYIERGEKRALELFHAMAERVPAYQDFLKSHNFDPNSVKTIKDFERIPPVSKDNYLKKYPREQLCWDGKFSEKNWIVSATSGSSGEPFYFPRTPLQDQFYEITAELYMLENFDLANKRTLYINAFPLGIWIGGLFTYEAIYRILLKNEYSLSLANPGINTSEVIKVIKNLGDDFDQIVIGAYGPFLKDIVDEGISAGVDWKSYDIGFVLSAEAFSEEFREYIYKKCGVKDVYRASLNHYGTVDLGTMSHETPVCILTRRLALQNKELYKQLFPDTIKLPTLTQYIPEMFYFEEADNTLLCSSTSGIPLVRYDLKDIGRVFTTAQLREWYKQADLDFEEELERVGIVNTRWNLPFVYVYERNDFSVSFFAFQIYPETIRKALLSESLQKHVTGKFSMQVEYNSEAEQDLIFQVELKDGIGEDKNITQEVAQAIVDQLLLESSEYNKVYHEFGKDRVWPIVNLWSYQDATYFKSGAKQKWVKK